MMEFITGTSEYQDLVFSRIKIRRKIRTKREAKKVKKSGGHGIQNGKIWEKV